MSEEINNKNSLEEMKKDLKSLLGIKRNKEPTTEEKNPIIVKSEITFGEQSKKIEINKPERQLLVNKKNESVIDLTLDDNENPNINNLVTNSSLDKPNVSKYENSPLNLSNKLQNCENKEFISENLKEDLKKEGFNNLNNNLINYISQDNTIYKEGNYNINSQNDFQIPHNSDSKNLVGNFNLDNEKDESNIKINQDAPKIDIKDLMKNKPEIENVNQVRNHSIADINEVKFDNLANLTDQSKNTMNSDIKASSQTESETKSIGFNLSSIKNLSMPKQDLLNFFKASDKDIFANLNVNQICFFPQTNNINKKEKLEQDIDKKLEVNPVDSNNIILNTRKENESQDEKKNFENENKNDKEINNHIKPQQAQKQGFSLDMVTGLNAEKDQIIKMFSNQIPNSYPLDFQTNGNLFFNMDKVKNQFSTQTRTDEDELNHQPKEKTQSFDISANQDQINSVLLTLNDKNITNNMNFETTKKEPEKIIVDINKIRINEKVIDSTKESKLPVNLNTENHKSNEIGINLNQETHKASTVEKANQLKLYHNEFANKEENMIIDSGNTFGSNINGLLKNLDEEKEKNIILDSKLDENIIEKSTQKINERKEKTFLEETSFQKPISINTENQDKNNNIKINENYNENQKMDLNINKDNTTNQLKNISNTFIKSKGQERTPLQNTSKPPVEIAEEIKIDNNNNQKINLETPSEINENNKEKRENNVENLIKLKDIQEVKNDSNTTVSNINNIEKPLEIKSLYGGKQESSMNIGTVMRETKNPDNDNLNKIEANTKNDQNLSKQAPSVPEPGKKRAITFQEAKEQIDKFSELITNLEIEMKEKYGINIPQFYYEDLLPESVKLKLVEEYFNDKDIIELGKQLQQKEEKK